ncbi:tripartite tricarboxylate transporter TctB family protein [Desulfovibrio sp. OttesenSCG-928-O18]|nr:tripartite tricarboxylate transporter TctB family protein [Desulfovibrio sp. OttesenSCG-928-O18]
MRLNVDFRIALILLAFCGFAAYKTAQLPEVGTGTNLGPDFFPAVLVGSIAFFSVILLLRSFIAPNIGTYEKMSGGLWLKLLLFLLLMIVYATFYLAVSWMLSAAAFFVLAMYSLGERRLLHVVVIPAGIILGVYFCFTKLMKVYLP